jgi:DnaJ domain
MDTLYELLGALPRDDAEGLRTAFRKAVKGTHPDLRPGDPEAALKFRQIVRANEILADPEQRAAYDHLLVLAQIEKSRALTLPIAAKIHKVASGMMAVASASIVTVGGYLIFMHMPTLPISSALPAPSSHTQSAHNFDYSTDLTARVSASIAAVRLAVAAPDQATVNALIARGTPSAERSTPPDEPAARIMASAELSDNEGLPQPVTITLPDIAPNYASVFHATRVSTSYSSEVASTDLEQAIELDPKLLVSYADRGIPLYPTLTSDNVFAEVTPTKHEEKSGHVRAAMAAALKHAEATDLPKVVPLPRPRTAAPLFRPRPWAANDRPERNFLSPPISAPISPPS